MVYENLMRKQRTVLSMKWMLSSQIEELHGRLFKDLLEIKVRFFVLLYQYKTFVQFFLVTFWLLIVYILSNSSLSYSNLTVNELKRCFLELGSK